jgi:ATP-dependent DNA ligase
MPRHFEALLEGVVAKRRSSRYVTGERGWIKTNRDYWRHEMERQQAFKSRAHAFARR